MIDTINSRNFIVENAVMFRIEKILNSNYYLLFIALLSVLFWAKAWLVAGLITFVLIASIILIIQRNALPAIIIVLFGVIIVALKKIPDNFWQYFYVFIPLAVAIIFHMFYYKNNDFKFGRLFFALIGITIVLFLGGIGSTLPQNISGTISSAALIGAVPFVFYVLINNYSFMQDGKMSIYVAKVLLYLGLAISIEILIFYYRILDLFLKDPYYLLDLGWAISNTIATVLIFTFPMGFYLYIKNNKWTRYIYLFLGVFEFAMIALTTSRGGLLCGAIAFLIATIATAFVLKGKEKKVYIILVVATLAIVAGISLLFVDKIKEIINVIFSDGLNDSGRLSIYGEAITCFKQFPVFGVGLGYIGNFKEIIDGKGMYLFHNTFFQVIASLGIFGVIGYGYYYFMRTKMMFENWDIFNLYVIIAYIGFEGYSMLNVGSMQGIPFGIMIILVSAAMENNSKLEDNYKIINVIKNKFSKTKV